MINLRRSNVVGEYEGIRQGARLILRVDVGTESSLDIISGDFFSENETGSYEFHHSFQTTDLMLEELSDGQILRSAVKVYREDMLSIARLDLTIPDTGELVAVYTFYKHTQLGRQTAATFTFPINKRSTFFRRVELEVDRVEGVPLPNAFQTDQHSDTPGNLPPRNLTFQAAYSDAGVDLVTTIDPDPVPKSAANSIDADELWSKEELHAAMVANFSNYAEETHWHLYLLLATRYVKKGVLGIMFDSGDDFPRQGAAVFYDHPAIANASELDKNREYLYTIIHELGHAFNLLHAFQKGAFQTHGILPRPASLSWMNYPQLYPYGSAFPPGWDGTSSFWKQFRFLFDREELAHIRHSDYLEVVMGGRSFGFAGHLEERPFESPTNGSLSLMLWVPPSIEFMQQLEGDIRLRNDGPEAVDTHSDLSLSSEKVTLLIRRPNDRFPKRYKNFYQTCDRGSLKELKPKESIYQEIAPSFGLRHWFLDEPGTYELQAIYHAPNGQKLASDIRKVRITLPSEKADKAAADFFTTDTGIYLGLEGSRSPSLKKAKNTLKDIHNKQPKSAISKQIGIVNSLCQARAFKDVENRITTTPDRYESANNLITALGVDLKQRKIKRFRDQSNLKTSRILRVAATSLAAADEKSDAKKVCEIMETMLKDLKAPKQAKEELKNFIKQEKI